METSTRRRGCLAGMAASALVCALSAVAAAEDADVVVPSAAISYQVPGDWRKQKPEDPQHNCDPELVGPRGNEVIDVLTPPNSLKRPFGIKEIKGMAQLYAATIEKMPTIGKCQTVEFISDHGVHGFNMRYTGTNPRQPVEKEPIENSVYLFANQAGDPVYVMYIANQPSFQAGVDDAIRKSLKPTDR